MNKIKQKYISCQLKVVQFSAEREFANSSPSEQVPQDAFKAFIEGQNIHWRMQQNGNDFSNQQYQGFENQNQNNDWF